jgi:hypothetical protein
MTFAVVQNSANNNFNSFNGFRPPYKIAQLVTFPNIDGRDAPGKTGAAAKPALVSIVGLKVNGRQTSSATTRFGLWSSTGTNGYFSDVFTLSRQDSVATMTTRNISDRPVFSGTQYWVGFHKLTTAQYLWGVAGGTQEIKQDNANAGDATNFNNSGNVATAAGSLIWQLYYDVLPTAPQSATASVSGTTITFSWSAPASDGGRAVTAYRVQRSTDNQNFVTITQTGSTSITDSGLAPGVTYYYRVAAINAVATAHGSDYTGPYSNTGAAITPLPTPEPEPEPEPEPPTPPVEIPAVPGNALSILTVTVANPNPVAVVFSDFGPGIRFTQIGVQYGAEYLYNQIEATTQDAFAETQMVEATSSKALYGVRTYSISSLLNATDDGALEVAKDYLTYFYQPELRVESVTVDLSNLTIEQRLEVLALEIDSYISISFTPNGVGDPKLANGLVTGISHRITLTSHEIEFRLRTERNLFILNSDSKGILNVNNLGF